MDSSLYQGWVRTVILPTSVSALCHSSLLILLAVFEFPGGLEVFGAVMVVGVFGIPLTFLTTNVAWLYVRHSSENDQSRIGTALALGAPAAVFITALIHAVIKT